MYRDSRWSLPPLLPAAALGALALAVATLGALWYQHEGDNLLAKEGSQMAAVASLKASLVGEWREKHLDAVAALADLDEVRRFLAEPVRRVTLQPALGDHLRAAISHRGASNAGLIDPQGRVLVQARPGPFHIRELAGAVLQQGSITHSDPHRHAPGDPLHLTFAAPVRAADGTILGAAVLRVEAEGFLFSIVREWPGGERTGEALLVAFEGDDAILLSGTRLVPHAPLEVHLPPERLLLPGSAPFTPATGTTFDYRGEPVAVALAPVARTSWMVLAKADVAEVLAPARHHALSLMALSLASVLATAVALALWWRRHKRRVLAVELAASIKQREAEQRLETLVEASHDAVFVLDEAARIRDVNDRAADRYGYAREELLRMQIADLRAPEAMGTFPEQWEASATGLTYETVHVAKDGRRVPVEVASRGFDVGGKVWRFSQVRDISRRKADEALTVYHAMLLQNLREAVIATDAEMRIRAWNGGAERLFGYPAEAVLGHPLLQHVTPQLRGTTPEELRGRVLRESEVDVDFRARRPDGTLAEAEFRLLAHRDPRGVLSFVGVGRDVTRRRLLEQRLQLALDGTGDGLWDLDTGQNRVWVSPAWVSLLGLPDEICEAGVEPLHSLFFPAEPEQKQAVQEHLEGLTPRYQYELRLELGGQPRWVAVRGKVVERGPDGGPTRLAGTFTDVTEKRAFQARLVSTDRLSSMGALAAGLAHEINNPLAYVVSNVAFAHEVIAPMVEAGEPLYGPDGADAVKALLEAVEGAERVRRIVHDLKTFSRTDSEEQGMVDVRETLRQALAMAHSTVKHRARLEIDFADVPLVEASEHRLGQVFLNLVVNAAQAIPEGQTDLHLIRVATRTFGHSVVVEVQDDGVGMSPEVLSRAFEPFFTTKPAGTGTGLGLSICHGIVTGMGGRIEAESVPGKGSTFRVVLPASRRAAPPLRRETPAPAAVAPGRLLLVEAEERVAEACRRVLSPPHQVFHEATAAGAAARLERGDRFDLVLCDLGAGDGSIDDLRATLAMSVPDGARRFVLVSAGAVTDGARTLLHSGLPVVEKPFQPAALRALVARLLSEASQPFAPLPALTPAPLRARSEAP